MSAFFVTQNTIDDCVTLAMKGKADFSDAARTALGKAMWNMNADAVIQRYPNMDTDEIRIMDQQISEYVWCAHSVTDAQLWVSMGCLLYQCCEGTVPDDYPLYAALTAFHDALPEPSEEAIDRTTRDR